MNKIITIIRGKDSETYDSFHRRVKDVLGRIAEERPQALHYTITLEKPPGLSLIPFLKGKIAMVSVHDDRDFTGQLKDANGFSGSFRVTEALPRAYERDWENGQPTPGVCLLTLFRQKKGIDYETFINRWHNGHTVFTLKVHPIFHYNRNVVEESFGNPPADYDGIVEEHTRDKKTLVNPFVFFGKPWMAPVNMVKTYFDVNSFIDYKSIETYLVREYHVVG